MKIKGRKMYEVFQNGIRCGIMPGKQVRAYIKGAEKVGDGEYLNNGIRYSVWEVC